jgi:ABC-type dipeptide/oligopeptide/nickel transport system permease component
VESTAFHQANLLHHLHPGNPVYQQRLQSLTGALTGHLGPSNAQEGAVARIYSSLQSQTAAQAYVDVYFALAAASAIMVLLTFLLDKNNPRQGAKTEIAVH